MKYTDKHLEMISEIPYDVNDDLVQLVQLADNRKAKDIAVVLDECRKDLLIYYNAFLGLSDSELADDDYGLNAYDTYLNQSEFIQTEISLPVSCEHLQKRIDDGYLNYHIRNDIFKKSNKQLNQNLTSTVQSGYKVYSIEEKIKYYSERIRKADKLKLSSGQVKYAENFLKSKGVKL